MRWKADVILRLDLNLISDFRWGVNDSRELILKIKAELIVAIFRFCLKLRIFYLNSFLYMCNV